MYLTNSVRHRLFSSGVDVRQESGIFAQPLPHLSSLILFLPLTVLCGSEVTHCELLSYREGKRKKVANLAFPPVFEGHLVLPWLCPGALGSLWSGRAGSGAQGLAGPVTSTHLPTSPPDPATSEPWANPSPQHSSAPRSCSLVLKPLMGIHTAHKEPFIDCSLQDVLADSTHTHTKSNGTRISSALDSPSCVPTNKRHFSFLISCIRANTFTRLT